MHYVIIRNDKPQGRPTDIAALLSSEGPRIREVLERNQVNFSGLVPSTDALRFAGIEQVSIPHVSIASLQTGLRMIGYGLSEPFKNSREAYQFWETGERN